MLEQLFNTCVVIGGVIALLVGAFPLRTWFTYRMEEQATVELLDLNSKKGDEVDDFMETTSAQLHTLGFEARQRLEAVGLTISGT